MEPIHWYIILVLGGLFMIGAEIYVPGGILGLFGSLFLICAIGVGFAVFGPQWGMLSAFLIITAAGACILVWIKYFPRTHVGRSLTLSMDASAFKATEEHLPDLMGKEGVAQTTLRPAGIATIDNQRVNVVAEGSWIESGTPVRVVHVEGNIITVRNIGENPAN